jgi:glycosyltransferase involved in cell wall biosynthesis
MLVAKEQSMCWGEEQEFPDNCAVKTVLLTNFIPPYRLELFRSLQGLLNELRIFVSTRMEPGRPWPVDWKELNVTVQRSISWQRTWRHPQGFAESLCWHVPWDTIQLLRQHRPDVVISGELGARSILSSLYCWMNPGTRHIIWATVSEHTEQRRGLLRSLVRHSLLPRADAVLVNGKSGERYVRGFDVRKERIFVAPYTTDMSRLLSLPLSRDEQSRRRLLFVGQLVERKGLSPFLAALVRWGQAHPQQYAQLCMVGDGPLRTSLQSLSLPDNVSVSWTGAVSYEDIATYYRQGGIFVFPTLADEWGLVTNEAMAAGLPVLGSVYSQAVEELIEDSRTGWRFIPDDPDDVDRALQRALSTASSALEEMGALARCRVRELTPELVAQKIQTAVRFVATPR